MIKRKFVFFFFLPIFLYATTIKEAWEIVQKNSAVLAQTKDDFAIAKAKQKSAKSLYLPSLSLNANYTYFDDPLSFTIDIPQPLSSLLKKKEVPITMSKRTFFLADLQMLLPLYTGGKIDATNEIVSTKVQEATLKQQLQKDKEFLTLVKYYFGVVIANELVKTRLKAKEAFSLHYKNAKKMFLQGQIAKVELLNAKVRYDESLIALQKAQDKLQIATKALDIFLHDQISPSTPLEIKQIKVSKEELQQKLNQQNVTLLLFDKKEKQTQAFLKIQKANFYPQVVAMADYNLYKDNTLIGESLPKWFASIFVKLNLLERKDRSQEVQIAKLMQQKVRHSKQETMQKLRLLLIKTYYELQGIKKEFELLASSLALAKENFKLRSLSFKEGLSTSSDVVDAQLYLESIQIKRLNAAYEYTQKLALLYVLSGERERFFDE